MMCLYCIEYYIMYKYVYLYYPLHYIACNTSIHISYAEMLKC